MKMIKKAAGKDYVNVKPVRPVCVYVATMLQKKKKHKFYVYIYIQFYIYVYRIL